MNSKLSKEPYKGVRDFYPEDMFIHKWIFEKIREVVERYGYIEYNASVLEPAELYAAKTGEEIVNEQTYTFTDRGEREVTLRPEMTPTVARMIANRLMETPFPARWYSIPNLFRYERPQRGRLREHWQLNVDMFGADSIYADAEVIAIAHDILTSFGVAEDAFVIKIGSRAFSEALISDVLGLADGEAYRLTKLIDKKAKMDKEEFANEIELLLGEKSTHLMNALNAPNILTTRELFAEYQSILSSLGTIQTLIDTLKELGVRNAQFDPSLMRGFDYYTGMIFEVFDLHPENNRSIFGGGRYDDLLDIFGADKVPAVGFGLGDVTLRDVLETYDLLPAYKPTTDLYICVLSEDQSLFAEALAGRLRKNSVRVAVDTTTRKVGTQIKTADRLGIPYTLCIGENEAASGSYTLKHLQTGEETTLDEAGIIQTIRDN